jgi:hypothetical protein
MATSQQQLVCDNSTLANFKQWAKAISDFFTTAGWSQSSDSGQVNWSTIPTVPGANAYVYEIWQPNDGLTNFYLKISYGNVNNTNCPNIQLAIGPSTNGTGTLTGTTLTTVSLFNTIWSGQAPYTVPSSSTQYECNLSGAAGRIAVMLWRNTPATHGNAIFAVERSMNSSGTYTSSYVTLYGGGYSLPANNGQPPCFVQQSLVFGIGAAPQSNAVGTGGTNGPNGGLCLRGWCGGGASSAFNNSIPVDFASPQIGYWDYAGTMIGAGYGPDFVDGLTFTTTVYGATRTYMPSKNQNFINAGPNNVPGYSVVMRYD